MASPIEQVAQLPAWQKAVVFVVFSGLIGGGWYYLYYADAVQARSAAEGAKTKAAGDLTAIQTKKANFEEEQRKAADMEKQIAEQMRVLPMSAATVDNLMQTFQQQGRMVGVAFDAWTSGGEERQDFYAKLPVAIRSTGSWHQTGEFFRRVTELQQIVSIEALEIEVGKIDAKEGDPGASPPLTVTFKASTFRFLSDEERRAAAEKSATGSRRQATPPKK
jgi:type IV pilus assembly protein PilO